MDPKETQAVKMSELTDVIKDIVEAALAKNSTEQAKVKDVADGADTPKVEELKGIEKELKFFRALVSRDDAALKDLSEGTDSAGGYTVPEEFYGRVIEKMKAVPSIRKLATVIPMNSDKLNIPVEGNEMSFYWPTENNAITASDPSFGEVELTPNLLAGLVKMSRQLVEDSGVNILDYLAKIIAKGLLREEDSKFTGGSGTGQPKGFRQYNITNTDAQAGASLAYTDVVNLFFLLGEGYRDNGTFTTSDTGAKALASIVDTANRPVFIIEASEDGLHRLFGKPLMINNNIPENLGTGTDETELWFGDFSYYMVGDREGISTEYSTQAGDAFAKHQGWLKVYKRVDGKLAFEEAMAYLSAVK